MTSVSTNLSRFIGAIRSGKRAVYTALLIKVLRIITIPIDSLFSKRAESNLQIPKIIFIVGPPRTGSTIVYQVLSRAVDCIYLSNIHELLPNKGTRLLLKNIKKVRSNKLFNNYYGYTSGIYDVSEANEIIDPIFRDSDTSKIRSRFLTLINNVVGNKNIFIFKNVRSYAKLDQFAKAVPEAIFLRIKRNESQNIQSVLRAYHELNSFHPIPDELNNIDFHIDPVNFATQQILNINEKLEKIASDVGDNWIEWNYEDFCENPSKHLVELQTRVPGFEFNSDTIASLKLKASYSQKVSDQELVQIEQYIADYKMSKNAK